MTLPVDGFLTRSKQRWKATLLSYGVALGGLTSLVGFSSLGTKAPVPGLDQAAEHAAWRSMLLFGSVLTCGILVWAIAAIQCPRCGSRLFWHAVKSRGPVDAFHWLTTLQSCPACGFNGDPRAT